MYYSTGGTLNLDKNLVSDEGGLTARYAGDMGMQPKLLTKRSIAEAAKVEAAAETDDDSTSANMKNWMECVRSRKAPNAHIEAGYSHSVALCMTIGALQSGQRVTFDDQRQEVVLGNGKNGKATTNE